METQTKNFTPEESLKLISETISNFKRNYKQDSYFFLLWGWIISLASISHFFILKKLHSLELYSKMSVMSILNWAFFVTVGVIILIFYKRKLQKSILVISHLERFIRILWQVSAIGFFLVAVVTQFLKIYSPVPFMLIIGGISTLVTGILIRFSYLIVGGILFFVFAVYSVFVPEMYQLLVCAGAIVTGYLIPGYILRNTKD
ncbi:MAG: hypothetical protein JW894_10870 [Bacteroidales bacterium]|nr:hypothetical protein [Bacteroidales bacterium]